jgi:serine/threonine protein kinase
MLAPHLAANGSARQRFAREARAAAAVVHEHVVAIHNVETSGTSPFLVMQYVAGESLQQRIDREGPLELKEILRIATQTASGLAAAHAQGLVHRDVKPANIMLEQGVERTLLTDFGLARAVDDASLTHTGYHPGTPQYMSPEQARGESVDARSDLFSLGSVIYTMCTGRPPFRAESTYGVLRRITDNEPRAMREISPHVPQWLEAVVAKLHAKMPDQRYTGAEEVYRLLERCLAHVQQPTTVALPDSCRSTQRDGNVIAKLWTPRTRLAAGLLAIAITVVFAIVGRGFFLDTPKAEMGTDVPDFTATEGASSSPSAVPTKDSSQEPSESWNANTPLITAFRDELESLEVRSRQVLLNPKLDTKDRQ